MKTLTIEDIANKYSLSLLLTFGSYNTERYTKDSDIDVGFISKVILDVDQKLNLLTDLIFFFGRDGIDLVDLSIGTPLLLYEVACKSTVLYEEDDSYLKFKMKASARYTDTKHLRKQRRKYLDKAIDRLARRQNYEER